MVNNTLTLKAISVPVENNTVDIVQRRTTFRGKKEKDVFELKVYENLSSNSKVGVRHLTEVKNFRSFQPLFTYKF